MGFIADFRSLFAGMQQFMELFRSFFDALPLVIKVLIYFSFGGLLLLCLLKMLIERNYLAIFFLII